MRSKRNWSEIELPGENGENEEGFFGNDRNEDGERGS